MRHGSLVLVTDTVSCALQRAAHWSALSLTPTLPLRPSNQKRVLKWPQRCSKISSSSRRLTSQNGNPTSTVIIGGVLAPLEERESHRSKVTCLRPHSSGLQTWDLNLGSGPVVHRSGPEGVAKAQADTEVTRPSLRAPLGPRPFIKGSPGIVSLSCVQIPGPPAPQPCLPHLGHSPLCSVLGS